MPCLEHCPLVIIVGKWNAEDLELIRWRLAKRMHQHTRAEGVFVVLQQLLDLHPAATVEDQHVVVP